ncbi:unnamed protein product, partial [Amoebophrya sp. A25]|eukprot:GSA25T00022496001.1
MKQKSEELDLANLPVLLYGDNSLRLHNPNHGVFRAQDLEFLPRGREVCASAMFRSVKMVKELRKITQP